MFRCIDQVQPDWVVAENVAGITTMVEQGKVSPMAHQTSLFDEDNGVQRYRLRETFTLERICQDLEGHGYEVQPVLIPACAVGAPHRRDRVFIVARRVVADTDNRADRRGAGQDEGKGREERIQERHEVWQSDEPNQVRRESETDVFNADTDRHDEGGLRASGTAEGERSHDDIQPCEQSRRDGQTSRTADVHGILQPSATTLPENAMHGGQLHGQNEEQGSERNIGNAGTRDCERICSGTSRTDSSDTDSHRGCEVDEHMESELADAPPPQ